MCHRRVFILDNEDASAAIFIEPNDDCASNEDSAVEDDGGLFDILSQSQLNAPAEDLLSNGRRITVRQTEASNKAIAAEQIHEERNMTFYFEIKSSIF